MRSGYEPEPDEILVADFEGDSYGDWQVEGEAFGTRPGVANVKPRNRVTGHEGRGLVNSFLPNDRPTGTLTSPAFVIARKHLCFLAGGGAHRGKTCMNLLVDDSPVRTAVGSATKDQGREVMRWVSWDVAEFAGKKAVLQIVDAHSGGWGHINIDHIVQRNGPLSGASAAVPAAAATEPADPSAPRTREIELTGKLLLVPIRPRRDPGAKTANRGNGLSVTVDGVLVHNVGLILASKPEQIEFWAYLDMSEYVGKAAKLEVRGPLTGDALALFESADEERYLKPLYTEVGRPQFHFSQKQGWNNDVNGMVYHDGLYHLSWQCNPVGRHWNNMYWGHAVSRDLVHWEEWPRILRSGGGRTQEGKISGNVHPSMAIRQCFSGSACVDINNTLGKQTGATTTLLACFTDTGSGMPGGPGEVFSYSTDGGRSYTYMKEVNPLISHEGRDPKLFWHEPTKNWCIVTYEAGKKVAGKGIVGGKMAFYSSPDLKTWTFNSFSDAVYHECPEFVQLPVDPPSPGSSGATSGDEGNLKWLLFDATPKYQIGTFDGKTFKAEFEGTRQTIGGSLKAAQCFSNAPAGRAICMVWARVSPKDPRAPYNQGFTLPLELSLRTAADGVRCYANPVKELAGLRLAQVASVENKPVADQVSVPLKQPETLLEIAVTLRVDPENPPKRIALQVGENSVPYDVATKTFPDARLTSFDKDDGKLDLRVFADNATVEVFGENGAVYYLQPRRVQGESVSELAVKVEGGSARIESLRAYRLKSIWQASGTP